MKPTSPTPKPRTSKLAVILVIVIISAGWIGYLIFSHLNVLAHNMWCKEHFCNFSTAFYCYNDNDRNNLPLPENWCDVLCSQYDIWFENLTCVESDTITGESAYAMNGNAVGRKLSELPSDMVFLFESDNGKEQTRSLIFTERAFVKSLKKNIADKYRDVCVYPLRWNQLGGPGDAAFRHFAGKEKCCHVLFVNGEIKLVGQEAIQSLCWTAQESNQVPSKSQ